MRTRDKFWFYVFCIMNILLMVFTIGGARVVNGQQPVSLEIRVQNLEMEVKELEVFKLRYEAWSWGGYSATLYSPNNGKHIVFENDTSWLKEPYVQSQYNCVCRLGDYKKVSLYDQTGKLLDQAEFFSHLKLGDYLVAWYSETKPEVSPGSVGVSPFYWSSSSGLAVGILRIDGTMAQ